jgi:hypothetical protein
LLTPFLPPHQSSQCGQIAVQAHKQATNKLKAAKIRNRVLFSGNRRACHTANAVAPSQRAQATFGLIWLSANGGAMLLF